MGGRADRTPGPLRLRLPNRLVLPRGDWSLRPRLAGALSFEHAHPPGDSAAGPLGHPGLFDRDEDLRVLLPPGNLGEPGRDRRDETDPSRDSSRHPDPRLVQQPDVDGGEFVRSDGIGRRQVRRRWAGGPEPLRPHRVGPERDAIPAIARTAPSVSREQGLRRPRGPGRRQSGLRHRPDAGPLVGNRSRDRPGRLESEPAPLGARTADARHVLRYRHTLRSIHRRAERRRLPLPGLRGSHGPRLLRGLLETLHERLRHGRRLAVERLHGVRDPLFLPELGDVR